jgi:putative acetyltransferase
MEACCTIALDKKYQALDYFRENELLKEMKIRQLTPELYSKASALLLQAFSPSKYEVQLFDNLHKKNRALHEWVCIHRDSVIAYIAFSNAYDGAKVCGLHLALLAVKPQMQGEGVGSELLRFSLRQNAIKETTIFVQGNPQFYQKFGFDRCVNPVCPFGKNNSNFLCIRNDPPRQYIVGYEPEFKARKK